MFPTSQAGSDSIGDEDELTSYDDLLSSPSLVQRALDPSDDDDDDGNASHPQPLLTSGTLNSKLSGIRNSLRRKGIPSMLVAQPSHDIQTRSFLRSIVPGANSTLCQAELKAARVETNQGLRGRAKVSVASSSSRTRVTRKASKALTRISSSEHASGSSGSKGTTQSRVRLQFFVMQYLINRSFFKKIKSLDVFRVGAIVVLACGVESHVEPVRISLSDDIFPYFPTH